MCRQGLLHLHRDVLTELYVYFTSICRHEKTNLCFTEEIKTDFVSIRESIFGYLVKVAHNRFPES